MFPILSDSPPLLELAIAGMNTLERTTITPINTRYETQITEIYDAIALIRSPSKNLISLESFAAVTKISEIFPPA